MQRTAFLLVLVAALAGYGMRAGAQCNENCPQHRTISVTGTAQVTADADQAIVRVGYRLYGEDAKSAYSHAADVSNAIMNALTSSGIPKADIESTSQVLQHTQNYDLQQLPYGSEERFHRQFTVTQSWTIRVKPDDAASALNTAINAGANESGWIQWTVADPNALEARASAEAVDNAHAIAEQIAQKSGVHLGQLVSVSHNQSFRPMAAGVGGVMGGIFGMGDAVTVNTAMQPGSQQFAINSRRVEYTVQLYVIYAIE